MEQNNSAAREYPKRKWLQSGTVEVGLSSSLSVEVWSPTIGIDSVPIRVEFFALDENGKVIPNIRNRNNGIVNERIATITGKTTYKSYSPGMNSRNGYMARVTIRAYRSNNDNSAGVDVTVIGD